MTEHKCSLIITEIMGTIERGIDKGWYYFHPQATWGVQINYCPWCGVKLE